MPEKTTECQAPVGLSILECTSEEERLKIAAGWTPADWIDALLDVGLSYEQELESMSIRSVGDLLAYPLGCLLGTLLSYALFARNLGLNLPIVGRVPGEVSRLAFFGMVVVSCSMEPLVALIGYGKASFGDGLFAAVYPGILYASTALYAIPLASALAIASLSITLIRTLVLVRRALSEADPLPTIVFGFRSHVRTLALALMVVMLAFVLGITPAGHAATSTIGEDARQRIVRLAGDNHAVTLDDLQGALLDELQLAVCFEARRLGIAPEETPRVIATIIPNERICAAFRPIDNTIIINVLDLSDEWLPPTASNLLFESFHELYHCQQSRYVRGEASQDDESIIELDTATIARWSREFALYPLLSSTPSGYFSLEVEEAADLYARAKIREYRDEYRADAAKELSGRLRSTDMRHTE